MNAPARSAPPREARQFDAALERHGRRRRWRRFAEGAALAVITAAAALLAAVLVMDQYRFADEAVRAARVLFYTALAAGLAGFLLPRLVARTDRKRLAAAIEARDPEFDAMLVSAVEARERYGSAAASPALQARLMAGAAGRLDTERRVAGEERRRTSRAAAAAIAAPVVAVLVILAGPPGLRHGATLLFSPLVNPGIDAAAGMPYRIDIAPGDAHIPQGADQRLAATAAGFEPQTLTLYARAEGEDAWRAFDMVAGEGGAFEGVLVNVERPTEYYAAGEGVESARHTITVEPPPTVSRIDLYYEFPARSRRPPELVENGGDIVAVEGTTVEVRVTPSRPVDTALVRLNDDTQMTMTRDGDVLSARIAVADDGHYHVELPVTGGGMVRASRDYRIDALADTLPAVRILAPSGDIDVTSIEEVAFELAASDDLAVRELELVLWVNGLEEEIVDLATPEGVAEVRTGHELLLEERELAPGDLIAYHVRARDTPGDAAREVTSDIYFMQVRPFDRRFSRAPGGGGGAGGGGGGGEDGGMLSAQQRQLVIALFNLRQMADAAAEDVVDDRIATLTEAQARIRDRVDAIVRRLESRQIPGIQATLDPMLDELPKASKAMREVEAELAEAELDPALESAREALVHLQRADAGFREMQVAMSNRGSGGSSNDLTNLFRLEMDRFRSNYEHVERGQWDSGRRELDEALRKLAELARRQQLELERRERQAAMGGGRSGASRDLVERAEELLRQLERLTRERPDPALERAAEAARDAARAMAEGGDADSQRQALRDLREAERALRERESGGITRGIDDALDRSRELVDRQGEVERGIEQLRGGDGEALEGVLEDKAQISRGAGELDATLERLAGDADDDTREALRRSRQALRARALEELAEQSGQRLAEGDTESTPPLESAIRRALEGARDAIGEAREIAGGSGAGDESAEALRELVRSQDRLQQGLREGARSGAGEQGGQSKGGGTGEPGQQAEGGARGEPGQQPGGGSPGESGGQAEDLAQGDPTGSPGGESGSQPAAGGA
ncbi:MAG TPA: hypothetical protein VKZ63_13760, partial [Kofleriaceae bacterium]|nr:hypothetical protein [Kofleriaceae bacterium]